MRLGMLENGTFTWDAMSIHDDDAAAGNGAPSELFNNSVTTGSKSYAAGATTTAPAAERTLQRTRAEANLHHVLHRLVAIVNAELKALVPSFSSSILQAPNARTADRAEFYSKEVFKEHKSYFKKLMIKKENSVHNHQFKGNYRVPDKLQYCFDRSFHKTFDATGMQASSSFTLSERVLRSSHHFLSHYNFSLLVLVLLPLQSFFFGIFFSFLSFPLAHSLHQSRIFAF
jgi:hypothetical protein